MLAVFGLGLDFSGFNPFRNHTGDIFLEKSRTFNAIGRSPKRLRPVFKIRQNVFGDRVVIVDDVAFGDFFFGQKTLSRLENSTLLFVVFFVVLIFRDVHPFFQFLPSVFPL
jgi:hypothetical protein